MEKIFLTVLNMSLTASFVIAAIMLVRLPLKKAPKIISYILWAVAGFRLVFPFTLEGVFSLLPFKAAPIPQDIAMQAVPRIDSGIAIIDNAVSSALPAASPAASANPLQNWLTAGCYIWLFGVVTMLVYSFVSIILLKLRLRGAVSVERSLCEADNLKTPFVIGLFRPKIYIPAGLSNEERRYIVLHEQTHIRRHDHVIKMFAYLVLCLHWFNPLVWAAFLLMGADMEMSCDERVMRELGGDIKNAYSLSLVRVAAGRKILNGSPLAFGEGGMKERIKNILNFKKRSRVMIFAAVALVAVLSAGFAVNRAQRDVFDVVIPEVYALSSDGASAVALKFSYTWDGGAVDTIGPWESEYKSENTVFAPDGIVTVQLDSDAAWDGNVELFLPDGTAVPYDGSYGDNYDGNNDGSYDRNYDGNGFIVHLPDGADEYICCIDVKYSRDNLHASYGFKVLRNDGAAMPYNKPQSLPPTINIPVAREGTTELLTAGLAVSDLGYAIYLLEDFVLTSADSGDVIHPAESSSIMKTITMGITLADGEVPLPESKTEDGIYTEYHRVVTINHVYDVTLSYPPEAAEGGAILLRAMMDTVVAAEGPISAEFLYGTWKVGKFLGFTAITKDDVEWPDGENIVGRTVIIGSDFFSTGDFGTDYAKYAVEIQNPVYSHANAEKGYDFAKYLSPTADKSILELNNEDILLINAESADSEIAGPALYLIDNDRLLISLNCDYFELEKVSSQIEHDMGNRTEEDFLNSAEGINFQAAAYEAAKAMLCADADELAKYLMYPNEASRSVRGLTDIFESVRDLTLVWSPDNIQSDNEIQASYRYVIEGEDSFSYVTMVLIKDNNVWKVNWIGIEK